MCSDKLNLLVIFSSTTFELYQVLHASTYCCVRGKLKLYHKVILLIPLESQENKKPQNLCLLEQWRDLIRDESLNSNGVKLKQFVKNLIERKVMISHGIKKILAYP